jgi:DNA-binding PadR family transcriptional regulator
MRGAYMHQTWSRIGTMDRPRGAKERSAALTSVEFHILLSLAASERHGYGIIQDIEARGETSAPDVGTMYRALARMLENGLIEAAKRRSTPARDAADERRNYYRITSAGLAVAKAEARRLETLTRAARLGGLLPKEAR